MYGKYIKLMLHLSYRKFKSLGSNLRAHTVQGAAPAPRDPRRPPPVPTTIRGVVGSGQKKNYYSTCAYWQVIRGHFVLNQYMDVCALFFERVRYLNSIVFYFMLLLASIFLVCA